MMLLCDMIKIVLLGRKLLRGAAADYKPGRACPA